MGLGTAEKSEHILLIGFHTGLVEGIDFQHVAADAAGEFKEVEQLAQRAGIHLGAAQHHGGGAAVVVSCQSSPEGHLAPEAHGLASQIVEIVTVILAVRDIHIPAGVLHLDLGV